MKLQAVLALAILAAPLSAQAQDEGAMRGVVRECIDRALPEEIAECALVATNTCIDEGHDYAALACPQVEYGIWYELVSIESERVIGLAKAFENRLYEADNDINLQYLIFFNGTITAQQAWGAYVQEQCNLGALANQLQRLDHPDPSICFVQKYAARLAELRALAPHFEQVAQ